MASSLSSPLVHRLRVEVTGAVQGVGFRPHVYRLATEAGLAGWVVNDLRGVRLEVEGGREALETFLEALRAAPPPRAVVSGLRHRWLEPRGVQGFRIRASDGMGERSVTVLPDLATCPACLAEILDPENRRHGYAFTNCTDCGPRFSIIRDLPYDRPATSMAGFAMCPACAREYGDPLDRRFHAQPNACPRCGPTLSWHGDHGEPLPSSEGDPLAAAARALARGLVVAVKGLGGFHLMCDAGDEEAVASLRARKGRPSKPLAVMVRGLEEARRLCRISDVEAALLSGPAAPIVLLPLRQGAPVAPSVAPGNPYLGVFLPYTPLHHLLLEAVGVPLVATSGNRSEEPICTGRSEAVARLGGIADRFLLHDRPIVRPVDDSVAAVLDGAPTLLRRSRGHAPLPLALPVDVPAVLAVGGQQKNAVALARGREAWVGQHVGELDSMEGQAAFQSCVDDLLRLHRVAPEVVAHDLHPDYAATRWALEWPGVPEGPPPRRVAVQHHHAHLASCLAEHGRAVGGAPVLGVIWDGTGFGTDGTVWGGEFLVGDAASVRRAAHLRPFRLPGGEAAIRDPRRVALALLLEAGLPVERAPLPGGLRQTLVRLVERGVAAPLTPSAGRLFDGVAALLGLVGPTSFEGEAAMALEFAADPDEAGAYPLELTEGVADGPAVLDWRPAVAAAVTDRARGVSAGRISARFHNGLVRGMVAVARRLACREVALSGGCFQNRILVDRGARALREEGLRVLTHHRVPPNDGGLALGQVMVAAAGLAGARAGIQDEDEPQKRT